MHRYLIFPILSLIAGDAFADAHITYRPTEGDGASMQSLFIGHGKLRGDVDTNTSVIFDPDNRSMLILDHRKRQVTHIGSIEMKQMGAALEDAMTQMEQAMANVPPEMRAQMQRMLDNTSVMDGKSTLKVIDTEQRDSVAGYPCTVYRTEFKGNKIGEACMGDTSVLDTLSVADRAVINKTLTMARDIAEQFTGGPLARFADITPFHKGMLPLRITDIDDGRRNTSEFAGVQTEPLAADLFAVPANYREQKIEMPRMPRMRR